MLFSCSFLDVFNDSIDCCRCNPLLGLLLEHPGTFLPVVIEEVFQEDCRTLGFLQDIEVLLPIPVSITHVLSDLPVLEFFLKCIIETFCNLVTLGLPLGGVARPTLCIHP